MRLPLSIWICLQGSYQFSQSEPSLCIHPGVRQRFSDRVGRRVSSHHRLSPGFRDEDPSAIGQFNIQLGFTGLAAVGPEHLDDLAAQRVMRVGNPHKLVFITSYLRSILLVLWRSYGDGCANACCITINCRIAGMN